MQNELGSEAKCVWGVYLRALNSGPFFGFSSVEDKSSGSKENLVLVSHL